MKTLSELFNSIPDKIKSDKGTDHDYIDGYYNELFTPLKNKKLNILEIGVQKGYSVSMWRDWFINSNIFAIDADKPSIESVSNLARVNGIYANGYCKETLDMFEEDYFDFIVEDGPHSLISQIYTAKHWTKKLKKGGKLIIEDIQNPDNDCDHILNELADSNMSVKLFDLRNNKSRYRYDDFIIEITKL